METRPSISGHEDPEGEAPWAMQLVARVEKALPPTHIAICEAAATSVVRLLADTRSQPGGEWFPRYSDGKPAVFASLRARPRVHSGNAFKNLLAFRCRTAEPKCGHSFQAQSTASRQRSLASSFKGLI